MRLLQNRLKKFKLFSYEKNEDEYVGTINKPVFEGFLYARTDAAETKKIAGDYGEKTEEILKLYCEYPLKAKCGDGIASYGKEPTHKITAVTEYGSYAELRVERRVDGE